MLATAMPPMIMGIRMTSAGIDVQSALKLQSWLSPAFPIGAFSYSHGLEPAIDTGVVADRAQLTAWVQTLLSKGSGRIDAWFFAAACRAAPDAAAAAALGAEALAWSATSELAMEAELQGDAFLKTVEAAWPDPALGAFRSAVGRRPPLSVAAGFTAGVHGAPLALALPLYLQAFAANLISAGVRLIPLGQTDGQLATAALEIEIAQAAEAALEATALEDLWTATPAHEISSMRHETQYARIFRS